MLPAGTINWFLKLWKRLFVNKRIRGRHCAYGTTTVQQQAETRASLGIGVAPPLPQESPLKKFKDTLPLEFALCGHRVKFELSPSGALEFSIVSKANTGPKGILFSDAKWMAFHRYGHPTATHDELGAFFNYFLRCSAGIKLLTFSPNRKVNQKRIKALTYGFDAWRRLQGPKLSDGRLKEAMFCIACFKTANGVWESCSNRTKDPSGLCRHHSEAGERTLWNYEPYSEWDSIYAQAAIPNQQQFALDLNRQAEIEAQRARREAKWKQVAAGINYTATDRQIFFLLDLGAQPWELQDITKEAASKLIDQKHYG